MSGGKSRKEAGERAAKNVTPSRARPGTPACARASTRPKPVPDYWHALEAEAARLSAELGKPLNASHIRERLLRAWAGLA
jgi:hypothetical protein